MNGSSISLSRSFLPKKFRSIFSGEQIAFGWLLRDMKELPHPPNYSRHEMMMKERKGGGYGRREIKLGCID